MSGRSVSDLSIPANILKNKDVSELEKLQEDDAHFVEFFSALELDNITKVKADRAAIVEQVQNLALQTSNLKPDYESKKSQLVDTSLRGAQLKREYAEQYEKLKKLVGNSDQDAILKDLQDSVKLSEQQAEESLEDFLAGKTEQGIEELIQGYLHHRTVYWLRKVKSEKLTELNCQPPDPPAARPFPSPSPSQSISTGPPPYPASSPSPASSVQPTPYGSYPSRAPQPTQSIPYPGSAQPPSYRNPAQSIPPNSQQAHPPHSQGVPMSSQPPYPTPSQSIPPHTQPSYPPPTQSYAGRPAYPQPGYSIPYGSYNAPPRQPSQQYQASIAAPVPGRQPASPQYSMRQPTPQYPAYSYHQRR